MSARVLSSVKGNKACSQGTEVASDSRRKRSSFYGGKSLAQQVLRAKNCADLITAASLIPDPVTIHH